MEPSPRLAREGGEKTSGRADPCKEVGPLISSRISKVGLKEYHFFREFRRDRPFGDGGGVFSHRCYPGWGTSRFLQTWKVPCRGFLETQRSRSQGEGLRPLKPLAGKVSLKVRVPGENLRFLARRPAHETNSKD